MTVCGFTMVGLATFARVAMAYVRASKRVQLLRACIRGVLDLLLARRAERVAVMQIGAHLAWMNYNDPFGSVVRHTLNRRNATAFLAVVVEPQPHVFQRLRQSSKQFAASGVVRFENVAVCASGAASVDFFLVDPSVDMVSGRDNRTGIRAPRWTSQIASLDRSQVVRKMPRVLRNAANYSEDTYIKRVRVPCASIAELVARHGIASESFGLLSIDTEGHDVKILQASPLHEFRPWILNWEKKFATADEICALLDRLRRLGYSCECGPENMWCYHRRVREAQVAACLEVPPSYEFTCLGRGSACSARYAPREI